MAEEKKGKKGCLIAGIIVAACLAGAIVPCGIVGAIAVPNLLNAIDRGKQKRTMADLRSLGTAVETYSIDTEIYPMASNIDELIQVLEPTYIPAAPRVDGWERPFMVVSTATGYTICSGGKDGGTCTVVDGGGSTGNFNDSIIFVDGEFVQWPEGQQQ